MVAVDTCHVETEATLNATRKTCDHQESCECPKIPTMRRVHKRGKQAVEAHMDRCITISHMLAYVSVMETDTLYRGWTKLSA